MKWTLVLLLLLPAAARANGLDDKLERMNMTLDSIETNQEVTEDAETSCQADLRLAQLQAKLYRRVIERQGLKVTPAMMQQALADYGYYPQEGK